MDLLADWVSECVTDCAEDRLARLRKQLTGPMTRERAALEQEVRDLEHALGLECHEGPGSE